MPACTLGSSLCPRIVRRIDAGGRGGAWRRWPSYPQVIHKHVLFQVELSTGCSPRPLGDLTLSWRVLSSMCCSVLPTPA